jgi:ubiquinone/menaquinone biosynthesis C-methylase UbiE/DNA-directed RNA polymerase subunit RPC12/RpoP
MPSVGATLAMEGVAAVRELPEQESPRMPNVELRCSACGTEMPAPALPYRSLALEHTGLECHRCSTVLVQKRGIWLGLPHERLRYYARFLRDYEAVRKAEGRGSETSEFYLALPYQDQTRRNSWQWAIRARTYKFIEQKILRKLSDAHARPLMILDLGAGNGWLSYRLATSCHWPVAVDLQTNAYDGLGAAVHYRSALPTLFPRFQAEHDRLPFSDAQFDCAIFNASFHYSENYDNTLGEAIRCLRPGGTILIADSPTYTHEESGLQMLEERRQVFKRQFGFASDSLASCEYLTPERLLALEARHDLEWRTHRVWYGLRWACRPVMAKLKKRREPSQFLIYTAQVKVP